jgi:glycosyltransferase involved in cell wall biosynthesis
MDSNIKISVLMAVYNGEKYIREAIDSILSQTMRDFEFIIVNDGSKDRTLEIIESYTDKRIVIVNNKKNLGLIDSLNKGLELARGKYIARLDHDDIAIPYRLYTQYSFMENHPYIDVVGSWTECIDPNGKSVKISRNVTDPILIKYEFIFNNVMLHSSIFFKTDLVRKNGGYSKEFIHSEDYEMYSNPQRELRCANIPEVLFKLRLHENSITGSVDTQPLVYINAINIVYRNMSKYIKISRPEFDELTQILIIKKPDSTTSFKNFFKALKALRAITDSFIKTNHIDEHEKDLVLRSYQGKRKMIINHFLIGKYRLIFKKNG